MGATGKLAPVRTTRHHYGIALCEAFKDSTHEADDLFLDPISKVEWKATGQIKWLVDKGSPIFPGTPRHKTVELWREFTEKDLSQSRSSRIVFVACPSDNLPSRLAKLEPNGTCTVLSVL